MKYYVVIGSGNDLLLLLFKFCRENNLCEETSYRGV